MKIHPPSHFVAQAASDLNSRFTVLTLVEATSIRGDLVRKFARHHGDYLWENVVDKFSIQHTDAWTWIDGYIGGKSFLLLFDQNTDKAILEFAAGSILTAVLAECPGFEFYVTDILASYLLCFNHHDFLIAAGDAIRWLRERRELE